MDELNHSTPWRVQAPAIVAMVLTATILMPLLIGYEPVGGDPDRIYRPIKAELARSLVDGHLPLWTDRLGLGVPLLAESHAAALYPPNWVLYRALDVSTAYRLAMWGHNLAITLTTFAYARRRGLSPWGAALSGVAFTFCGMQAIHSSHEWTYHALPFLPLALVLVEGYVATGRAAWLAGLAIALGTQWTLGHFQIPTWTNGLVIVAGLWRALADRRPAKRLLGVFVTIGWGMAIAMAQLGTTWELAEFVGRTRKSFGELAFYSYPPAHWAETAIPWLFRGLRGGAEDPYWFGQQTTGYEVGLYIGTIPLLLAFVGLVRKGRGLGMWRVLVPATLALATMPRWWPQGYAYVLMVPGLGLFRCPARYTILSSLGLALFAGAGLDRAIGARRFGLGIAMAVIFGLSAFAWGAWWTTRPEFARSFAWESLATRLGPAAVAWMLSLLAVIVWRRGWIAPWVLLGLSAIELGILYYTMTTVWGPSVNLPSASPILSRLQAENGEVRVGGGLDNLPVRAGVATATTYIGFPLPPPNDLMRVASEQPAAEAPAAALWLRRLGTTHLVWDRLPKIPGATEIYAGTDDALDRLAYKPPSSSAERTWHLVRLPNPYPFARVATRFVVERDRSSLLRNLSIPTDSTVARFVAGDEKRGFRTSAGAARVTSWRDNSGVIEHDGSCLLILGRTWYPGWTARVNEGSPQTVLRVDGGQQAIAIEGQGPSRVTVEFTPSRWGLLRGISLAAVASAAGLLVLGLLRRKASSA